MTYFLKKEMLVYNIFTTNSRWFVISEQKSHFNNGFKLKTHNNLSHEICCEYNTSLLKDINIKTNKALGCNIRYCLL